MMNEGTALLNSSKQTGSSNHTGSSKKKSSSWTLLVPSFLCVGLLLVSGVNAAYNGKRNSNLRNDRTLADEIIINSDSEDDACVSMCTGVYTSTCIAYGNENLPLPSGIMEAYEISAGSKDGSGGIDYYLLSSDPDYLGLEWREHGHYTLQDNKTAPSPVENCAGSLDLQAWDGSGEWIPFHFDMEWNTNDNSNSFYLSTAIGFNCHYVKIDGGEECKEAYRSIVNAFREKDIEPEIPSEDELCLPTSSSSTSDNDIDGSVTVEEQQLSNESSSSSSSGETHRSSHSMMILVVAASILGFSFPLS